MAWLNQIANQLERSKLRNQSSMSLRHVDFTWEYLYALSVTRHFVVIILILFLILI